MPPPQLDPRSTLFFVCDLQTKFRPAIHAFDQVVNTTNKLLKLAKILGIEVVVTTQNAKALGPIVPEIDLASLGSLHLGTIDKKLFSMLTPEVKRILDDRPHIKSVVLFGIESHICILQTSISLLSLPMPIIPHVVADGVSSTNAFEIPVAMERIRGEGGFIETSESICFQLIGDAGTPQFKAFSALIKEEKARTTTAGEVLLLGRKVDANLQDTTLKSAM